MSQDTIYKILIFVPPLLFSLSFHEAAHAWMAKRRGDDTAERMGRLTMNPLSHIDPFGTLFLPVVFLMTMGSMFGYAKPVPVDSRNLRHPRRDHLLIALAGPVSNLILAVVCAILIHVWVGSGMVGASKGIQATLMTMLFGSVTLNLALAFFNLLPIPMLDGGYVLQGLVPENVARKYDQLQPYGFIILLALIWLDAFKYLFIPIRFFQGLLLGGIV